MRGDISIHTIESDIFWEVSLEFCHEWDECCVIIGDKFSSFPHSCQFRIWSNDEGIYFEFIRTKVTILKYFFHRYNIIAWSCTDETRHHMRHYFKTCIFEKSCCMDRFFVSMSSLIEFIDMIECCLISDLYSSYPILSQSDNLSLIYPVWTCFYGHTDHS
jgi:hypothetical protein